MAMIKTCSTPPIAFPEVSGPVCSFKALQALPLKKCEVAINAWQEGSGDPSPDNERAIHGWNEVNVTHAHKNLCNLSYLEFNDNKSYYNFLNRDRILPFLMMLNQLRGMTCIIGMKITGTSSGNVIGQIRLYRSGTSILQINPNQARTIPDGVDYTTATQITIYGSSNGASVSDIMLEVGSTQTAYEPYVTPEVNTISLGEAVYGGSYNSVSGNKITNRKIITTDGTENVRVDAESIKVTSCCGRFIIDEIFPSLRPDQQPNGLMCDKLKFVRRTLWAATATDINAWTVYTKAICINVSNELLGITDYTQETTTTAAQKIKQFLADYKPVFIISTQDQSTQLTPVQIDTILNTNNIFADTGDTTVQYIKIGG